MDVTDCLQRPPFCIASCRNCSDFKQYRYQIAYALTKEYLVEPFVNLFKYIRVYNAHCFDDLNISRKLPQFSIFQVWKRHRAATRIWSIVCCTLQVAGKTGRVVAVDSDGDVKVEIAGNRWLFNPQCCIIESQAAASSGSDDDDDNNGSDDDGDGAVGERPRERNRQISPTFCARFPEREPLHDNELNTATLLL